jgi:hypothetical protein
LAPDITLPQILALYDVPQYPHSEALLVCQLPNETLQIWFRREHLNWLGIDPPGRGRERIYSLWQLMSLDLMRRLTHLSVPVDAAADVASIYQPDWITGRPRGAVADFEVERILPVLEAARHPVECVGQVFALVYRIYHRHGGEWTIRIASSAYLRPYGGLEGWLSSSVDLCAIAVDLGQQARQVIVAAVLDRPRRAQQEKLRKRGKRPAQP